MLALWMDCPEAIVAWKTRSDAMKPSRHLGAQLFAILTLAEVGAMGIVGSGCLGNTSHQTQTHVDNNNHVSSQRYVYQVLRNLREEQQQELVVKSRCDKLSESAPATIG